MEQARGPIRLGFLGADEATPALVRAAAANRQFDVVGICELEGERAPWAAQLRPIQVWEQLLDDERFDAVVVARGVDEDRRAEQLRKFLQTGTPVLAAHPVVDSMLLYYELDMIRRETRAVVAPSLSGRNHPAVQVLAEFVRAGETSPIGKAEQVTVERCLDAATKRDVERQFARDVDLVRAIAGDMTRLGAMAASGELQGSKTAGRNPPGYAGLGVQMSGPAGIAARWSVVPMHTTAGAKITLTGSRGRVVLEVRPEVEPWTLALTANGQTDHQQFDAWDAAGAALEQLAAALGGETPVPDWVDACRSVELAETIERSLKKSRTIELYYEDYTEEGTFKGTMTSLGCGLLLAAICLLALVGLAEQMHIPYVKYWPYALLGIFAVFLGMQLVMLTSGKDRDQGSAGDQERIPPMPLDPNA